MDKNAHKLIFVYNVDNNPVSLIGATVHKLVSPKTYTCNLCKLTYPFISMKKEWKKFLLSLPYEVITLNRDEFNKQYPKLKDVKLPAMFIFQDNVLNLLVSAKDINMQKDIEGLKMLVSHKIKSI